MTAPYWLRNVPESLRERLRALGRIEEATARQVEAETGFRRLGAASLLERLEREWSA
jgi:hypothetical protein